MTFVRLLVVPIRTFLLRGLLSAHPSGIAAMALARRSAGTPTTGTGPGRWDLAA